MKIRCRRKPRPGNNGSEKKFGTRKEVGGSHSSQGLEKRNEEARTWKRELMKPSPGKKKEGSQVLEIK